MDEGAQGEVFGRAGGQGVADFRTDLGEYTLWTSSGTGGNVVGEFSGSVCNLPMAELARGRLSMSAILGASLAGERESTLMEGGPHTNVAERFLFISSSLGFNILSFVIACRSAKVLRESTPTELEFLCVFTILARSITTPNGTLIAALDISNLPGQYSGSESA